MDNDAISAFQNGTSCTFLIHQLGRRTLRTTQELLDITSNHAGGEETVGVTLNTPRARGNMSWTTMKEHPHASRRRSAKNDDVEGPIRRTREGGSEWEPIKILLEGDENSNKTNAASNTRLRLTPKVGLAHVATGVPLDLGTNTQPSDLRNAAEKPNLESTDPHRSDR
jgi:hypothetical protein